MSKKKTKGGAAAPLHPPLDLHLILKKICLNYWYPAVFVLLGTCTEYLNEIFCYFVN